MVIGVIPIAKHSISHISKHNKSTFTYKRASYITSLHKVDLDYYMNMHDLGRDLWSQDLALTTPYVTTLLLL